MSVDIALSTVKHDRKHEQQNAQEVRQMKTTMIAGQAQTALNESCILGLRPQRMTWLYPLKLLTLIFNLLICLECSLTNTQVDIFAKEKRIQLLRGWINGTELLVEVRGRVWWPPFFPVPKAQAHKVGRNLITSSVVHQNYTEITGSRPGKARTERTR